MTGLIKKLGSVAFTVGLSIALIALLIVSTSLEAMHGTPFAQKVFYQTRWFDFLMSLLWVNIFCSTVIRFPFKKNQIGFLITHIGILGILAGAIITRMFAIDGQLTLAEGEEGNALRQDSYALSVQYPSEEFERFALRRGDAAFIITKERLNAKETFCSIKLSKDPKAATRLQGGEKVPFTVMSVVSHAAQVLAVTPGTAAQKPNHAVRFDLKSRQMGIDMTQWLVEHDPSNASANEFSAGPARIVLRPYTEKRAVRPSPVLRIVDKAGQELSSFDVTKSLPDTIPLKKTGLTVKNVTYYPYASVGAGNKLINMPEGKRENPAVVFDLVDGRGNAAHMIRFGLFPDFESMHADGKKPDTEVKVTLDVGDPDQWAAASEGLQLALMFTADGKWRYRVTDQGNVSDEGDLVTGKAIKLGGMDLTMTPQEFQAQAQIAYDVRETKDGQGAYAAAVVVPASGSNKPYWAMEGQMTPVPLDKGNVYLSIVPQTHLLPFTLALKAFRKVNYPGTQNPASYESDVVLRDQVKGVTMERTISMNQPLVYEGYKIFQTSFVEEPGSPKMSVFTVAKNPGIPWIYISSIIACIGAMIQFFAFKENGV